MARKPKIADELVVQKPEKKELVYSTYEQCETEYLNTFYHDVSLIDFDDIRCNKANYIESRFLTPLPYFIERKAHNKTATAEDLSKLMETLRKITLKLSENTRFQPTIFTFCKMLNISTQTFNNWSYENNDRGEMVRQIQDYFKSIIAQGMLTGEYNPVAGSFLGKATLGMKEQDTAQTNINIIGTDMKLEDILADYQKNLK